MWNDRHGIFWTNSFDKVLFCFKLRYRVFFPRFFSRYLRLQLPVFKLWCIQVLFPQDVPKIIFIDADQVQSWPPCCGTRHCRQVVRADVKELWELDLQVGDGATIGHKIWAGRPSKCQNDDSIVQFFFCSNIAFSNSTSLCPNQDALPEGKVYGFVPMGDSNPDTEAACFELISLSSGRSVA